MSEEDTGSDWFESALSDENGENGDDSPLEDERASTADRATGEAESGSTDDNSAAGDEGSPFEEGEESPFEEGEESPFEEGEESPFEGVEADAGSESGFEDGDDSPFDGGDDGPFDGGDDGPFAGGDSMDVDDDPFGDDDDSLFDDDFASAFQSAPGPGGGGGESGFDDEDFESDIPRIDLGIDGLDEMIQGGVPERHLMVAIGSAGTGKTTFGLQFLNHGLENGEHSVFITLEQSREAIMATADDIGWDFEVHEDEGSLAVVDLDPVEMANSLDNIRSELPELIERFGADRLVLDSVSLLEMMYDDQARRRTEVFDFTRSLKNAGVTTMLTSEASESNPYSSRHGIIEYLTDAVFVLQYVRSEGPATRLAVEIQKIRNANHSRETKPYEIAKGEITVYQQANIF